MAAPIVPWNACTHEPSAWLKWFESHPGTANWFAAVATSAAVIVAIGIAIAGLFEARLAARRQARADATFVAVRLKPKVMFLLRQLDSVEEYGQRDAWGLRDILGGRNPQEGLTINNYFDEFNLDKLSAMPIVAQTALTHIYWSLYSYNDWITANLPRIYELDLEGKELFASGVREMHKSLRRHASELNNALARFVPEWKH